MARTAEKCEVLRAVAEHDGEWYWYQVDRAVSNGPSRRVGPFFPEIDELVAEGLIVVHPCPDQPGGVRYWLTKAGRATVAEQRQAEPEAAPDCGA